MRTRDLVFNKCVNGNILTRTDMGTYGYSQANAGPHTVTGITDATGTLLSEQNQSVSYTAFNKVSHISQRGYDYFITYGPDRLRRRASLHTGMADDVLLTKYYAFGDYEKEVTPAVPRHLHYIQGGDGLAAVYVKNEGGSDSLYLIMKDHLGSIIGAINQETGTVYLQNFDAWGRKRNPQTWTYTDIPEYFPLSRGFTGHEHLKWFGLINMNGRMYDAGLCRFLSPDPYVQMPDYSQNFNRYSYALNNPLVYTDPSGEFLQFIPAIIHMAAALAPQALMAAPGIKHAQSLGYNWNDWQTYAYGAGSWAINATATIATMGVGGAISGTLGVTTTLGGAIANGAIAGAAGGFAGGFIGGSGGAWLQGANFRGGLNAGLVGGGFGAAGGALTGGIMGGINHQRQIAVFQKGCLELGIHGGDPVPATDQFLTDAQPVWYKNAPMNRTRVFTVENVPVSAQLKMDAIGAPGLTYGLSGKISGNLTGNSVVYFNKNLAFSSAKQLFFTMGHEFVHVSQFAALAGESAAILTSDFVDMLDFHAYSYQNSLGGLHLNSYTQEEIIRWANTYHQFKAMNYQNFSWTFNHSFIYPF
jgi:RHS repeat-associated protein